MIYWRVNMIETLERQTCLLNTKGSGVGNPVIATYEINADESENRIIAANE